MAVDKKLYVKMILPVVVLSILAGAAVIYAFGGGIYSVGVALTVEMAIYIFLSYFFFRNGLL